MNRTLVGGVVLFSSAILATPAAEFLGEAEWLATDESVVHLAGRGYGFARPELAVSGWIDVQAKTVQQGAFVPNREGVRLVIPDGTVLPGQWRLSLRILRWTAA